MLRNLIWLFSGFFIINLLEIWSGDYKMKDVLSFADC